MADSNFAKDVEVNNMERGQFAFNTFYTDEQLRSIMNRSMANSPRIRETEIKNPQRSSEESNASQNYTDEQLRNVLTNTATLPPELFEKLYLSPQSKVKGDMRKTVANPTPLAIMGFAIALFPLSIELSEFYLALPQYVNTY